VLVHPIAPVGVQDPKRTDTTYVRTGAGLPSIAVDHASGALYVAWEDRVGDLDGVLVSASIDAGLTWSAPVAIDPAPAPAFDPAIAVAADGAVGVTYYDTRDDDPADLGHFRPAAFLATSHDG